MTNLSYLSSCIGALLSLSAMIPANAVTIDLGAPLNIPLDARGSARYVVLLTGKPVALYDGSDVGLPSIPRRTPRNSAHVASTARGALDVNSTEAQAYAAYLEEEQQSVLDAIRNQLRRPIIPAHKLRFALNALVLDLTPAEAAQVARLDRVKSVLPNTSFSLETDRSPQLIGATALWNGSAPLATDSIFANGFDSLPPGSQGEGVVIGVLDTGINFDSPSFAATDELGYTHINPLGRGNYLGVCAAGQASAGRCNNKLIGAFDWAAPGSNGVDTNEHGSHTASTAAGNHRSALYYDIHAQISGIAPHANVIAFRVCTETCATDAVISGIDESISLGIVDVLNFSVSGGLNPWSDPISQAFLAAEDAGIFVAAAAGNTSNFYSEVTPGSVNHDEPWVMTVAAGTHDGGPPAFYLTGEGDGAPEPILVAPAPFVARLSAPIASTTLVISPSYGQSGDGCASFATGQFAAGVALMQYSATCATATMATNAENAGAALILIANSAEADITSGATTSTPVFTLRASGGDALRSFANANPAASVLLPLPVARAPQAPDWLASFSLKGPSPYALLKPDLQMPGVNVLAAINTGADVDFLSGTSMASPHGAGAAALLRALHSDWTPAEVKSALQMTSIEASLEGPDGNSPSTYQDRGSGRAQVDLAAKSGLVLDETALRFSNANPTVGANNTLAITADELNLASIQIPNNITANDNIASSTSSLSRKIVRRFRSTLNSAESWSVSLSGALLGTNVSPTTFNIQPGGIQTVTLTLDASEWLSSNEYSSEELVLTPASAGSPTLHLPLAVRLQPARIMLPELHSPYAPNGPIDVTVTSEGSVVSSFFVGNLEGGETLHATLPFSDSQMHEGTIINLPAAENPDGILAMHDPAAPGFDFYGLQKFELTDPGFEIGSISVDFIQQGAAGTSPPTLYYTLYADNDGKPDTTASPVWQAAILETSASLTFTPAITPGQAQHFSAKLNTQHPDVPSLENVPAGRYWLSVQRQGNALLAGLGLDTISFWLASSKGNGGPVYSLQPSGGDPLYPAPVVDLHAGLSLQATRRFSCDVSASDPRYTFTSSSIDVPGGLSLTLAGIASFGVNYVGDGGARQNLCMQTNDPVNPVFPVYVRVTEQ